MSLVYAGVLSHAPGITGRADLVENTAKRDEFYASLDEQRQDIEASGADALMVVEAEPGICQRLVMPVLHQVLRPARVAEPVIFFHGRE